MVDKDPKIQITGAARKVLFWDRPRLPRGFWKEEKVVNTLRRVLNKEITEDQALEILGGREVVNLADIRWYVNLIKNHGTTSRKGSVMGGQVQQGPRAPERVVIGEGGRLVIPASYRQALALKEGEEVIIRVEEGELRILTPHHALQRAQMLVRRHVPATRSLADELIEERRQEARRE